jgi:hypothetical protein
MTTAGEKLATAARLLTERDEELASHRRELAARDRRIDKLDRVAERLAGQVVERERELRGFRAELERAEDRSEESARVLAALADDLETVRRQARRQATRMRLRALRETAELSERIDALAGDSGERRERLIESLEEAISRVGSDEEQADADLEAIPGSNGEAESGELFDGSVEVDVGPLSDFSQLVGFEDAANAIDATSEISVKRFRRGRATLTMRFKHPVELLRELEERAPFEFKARDARSDRLVLDVAEPE